MCCRASLPIPISARRSTDGGFTLLEVMVVVLVIGILLAVGIPTYLGARGRAQDKAAESSLRNGLTAASAIFTDNASFADATPAELTIAEPGFSYVGSTSVSTDDQTLSVASNAEGTVWGAAVLSDSGTCHYVRVDAEGEPTWSSSAIARCSADQTLVVSSGGGGSGEVTFNLALGQPSSQSSLHGVGYADRGNDGNTDSNYWNHSVFHTSTGVGEWWEVDLGETATIDEVRLFNRLDGVQSRAQDVEVYVDGTLVGTAPGVTGNPSVVDTGGVTGRVIRVVNGRSDYFHLAEVEVLGR